MKIPEVGVTINTNTKMKEEKNQKHELKARRRCKYICELQ